jgi:UDP-N-acetylglucosamine 2-epimerase (non-hydrolysing)
MSGRDPDPGPIVHIVGARPNFIKAAPVVQGLVELEVPQRIVHTGQHYDPLLSDVFFRELDLPSPDVSLGVGSGSHAHQTAALLTALEDEVMARPPGMLVVYGDVNSTLAAALVAAKQLIPLAHVEAGLRSFDPTMPEEINRRVTDALSDVLFVTSPEGMDNLAREGVDSERCHFVGNPMIDTLLGHMDRFDPEVARSRYGLEGRYAVATLHRPANVDTRESGERLVAALEALAARIPIVLPLHPRGRAVLSEAGLEALPGVHVIDPLGYIDFLSLVRGAALVVTDSGGIQEETTILGVPCLTLRPNTERPITITHGTNQLVEPETLVPAAGQLLDRPTDRSGSAPPLWDGKAGERIAAILASVTAHTAPALAPA